MEDRIRYVYFVNAGIVSLITHLKEGSAVEVAMTGREGMVGLPIALGDDVSPTQAIVQIAGGAMRLEAATLREEPKRGACCTACYRASRWRCSSRSRSRRPATAPTTSPSGSRGGC